MKVVTVLILVGLVLADIYTVSAESHLFPPLPEGECGEPQPNGLTSIVNSFSETFPTYEFLGIFLEAVSEDAEVERVLTLLMTEEFNSLINKAGQIDEWVEITDIFCDDLQFNVNFYLKVFSDLFKIIPIDTSTPKSTNRSSPGVVNLVRDIIDILPMEEWQPKLNHLVDFNENVQYAIRTVKGNLFRTFFDKVTEMEEYKLMRLHLINLNLPVDCGISQLRKTLGWSYNTCVCGTLRQMNQC